MKRGKIKFLKQK